MTTRLDQSAVPTDAVPTGEVPAGRPLPGRVPTGAPVGWVPTAAPTGRTPTAALAGWMPAGGALTDAPTGGVPTSQASPDRSGSPSGGRPRGPVWLVVTMLGVVLVAALGAMTTARVGAVALAVLVVGCAAARAASEPGPAALSVRSRRTDVLVLSLLAVALGTVATQLPAS